MTVIGLDFERHLIELEKQIDNMKKSSEEGKIDLSDQIAELQMQLNSERKKLYKELLYQVDYVLKQKGKIVFICEKDDIKQFADKLKFLFLLSSKYFNLFLLKNPKI